jgi:hypothetical protein
VRAKGERILGVWRDFYFIQGSLPLGVIMQDFTGTNGVER